MYGKEISERIDELHYNIKQLASNIGVCDVEMYRIKNDERNLIDREVFSKLMEHLSLDPTFFGGFVRLDFKNDNDFYNGTSFINNIKEKINNDPDIKSKDLATYLGISESMLSCMLSFKKTTIPIDRYYLLCKFFNLNYQDYLVDKNIYPSSNLYKKDLELDECSKLEELIEIANNLDDYEINKLINYAKKIKSNKKLILKK